MLSLGKTLPPVFYKMWWFIEKKYCNVFVGILIDIGDASNDIVLPIEVHAVVKQIISPSAYRTTFGFLLLLFSKQKQDAPVLVIIHKWEDLRVVINVAMSQIAMRLNEIKR